ncbi:MAG: flagellar motor switch protein FliN [Candidatus Kryptoniota bacterium]
MAEETVQKKSVDGPNDQVVENPVYEDLATSAGNQDTQLSTQDHSEKKLDILLDLNLTVSVELGRTTMMIKDILELGRGSIIEFDKLVSDPVDILVNGKKMAEGEVVVVDKHFGIRVTSLIDPSERLKGLRK